MFGMDMKSLMSGDLENFASQLQHAGSQGGGLNPMAMFQGASALHSVFLAPLSSGFEEARQQFLAGGTGVLSGLLQSVQQQGLSAVDAQTHCRKIVQMTQAMLVCVRTEEHGVQVQAHMFFGAFTDEYLAHIVATHTADERASVAEALERLRQLLTVEGGVSSHRAFVCLEELDDRDDDYRSSSDARAYWCDLAEQMFEGLEQAMMPGHEHVRDLAFWICSALPAAAAEDKDNEGLDGEELLLVTRCATLAGDMTTALRYLGALLEDYEPDADALLQACEEVGAAAIGSGQGMVCEQCFATHQASIDAIFDGAYEFAALRFRVLASAGVSAEVLLPAAQRMYAADASSFRHDVHKEPLWRVTTAPTGRCVDTADAAEIIDRGTHFVSKRLDAGTMPSYTAVGVTVDAVDVSAQRIPEQALLAWQAVIEQFAALT